jgi:putative ABC transport system permease protein
MNLFLWMRRDWRFFSSLLITQFILIVLGLVAFLFVTSLRSTLDEKLSGEQKNLLTSDLSILSRTPLSNELIESVKKNLTSYSLESYLVSDLYTMAVNAKSESKLVEIRATEKTYPFYGQFKNTLGERIHLDEGIVISHELASLWKLKIGDEIKLGESSLRVFAIIKQDSSLGWRGFALAPRIYLPFHLLSKTGLLKPGSTGGFALHFKWKNFLSSAQTEKIEKDLKVVIPDPSIKIQRQEKSQGQLQRITNILSDFVQLMTLIGFCLSLIGFFYLERSFLILRQKDLSLYRVLGLTSEDLRKYLRIMLSIKFLCAFILSYLLSFLLLQVGKNYFQEVFQLNSLTIPLFSEALIYGFFLYFLLVVLLDGELKAISFSHLGGFIAGEGLALKSHLHFGRALVFIGGLWGLFFYVTKSMILSSSALGATLLAVMLFFFFGKMILFLLKKNLKPEKWNASSLTSKLIISSIVRRPQVFLITLISISLSWTLMVFIVQLKASFMNDLKTSNKKPSLFLFDIQPEQKEALSLFEKKENITFKQWAPLIRAKLTHINEDPYIRDESIALTQEDEDNQRFKARMMNLTYAQEFNESEELKAGKPFDLKPTENQISLEIRFANRLGIKLGDLMTFDILGVPVIGRVVNFKAVKWTSFRPNFFITFSPGALEGAPQIWLSTLSDLPLNQKFHVMNQLALTFPTISVLDMEVLVSKIVNLFELASTFIGAISWFGLVVGGFVLFSLAFEQTLKRQKDFMLLKILGLSLSQVKSTLLLEFFFIFCLSLGLGLVLGSLFSWGLCANWLEMQSVTNFNDLFLMSLGLLMTLLLLIYFFLKRFLSLKPSGLFLGN